MEEDDEAEASGAEEADEDAEGDREGDSEGGDFGSMPTEEQLPGMQKSKPNKCVSRC